MLFPYTQVVKFSAFNQIKTTYVSKETFGKGAQVTCFFFYLKYNLTSTHKSRYIFYFFQSQTISCRHNNSLTPPVNLFEEAMLCLFGLVFVAMLEEKVICNNILMYFVVSLEVSRVEKRGTVRQ